ncbi:MAG: hypothetical protein ISP55_07160, partial [Flavobacteriales bacterium]|nr:hypothetical protein [Flavobacteriales bacterium]
MSSSAKNNPTNSLTASAAGSFSPDEVVSFHGPASDAFSISQAMFITPPDVTGPTVTLNEPDDVVFNGCHADFTYSTAVTGKLHFTVSDDCGSATASYTTVDSYAYCAEADDSSPEGGLVITRTFTLTAEDCYGNETIETATQLITVVDDLAPVFTSTLPNDTTVDCGSIPAALTLTATDTCDTEVSISVDDVTSPGPCVFSYTITRTYTAVDDCGNETPHVQVITVEDSTDPTIDTQASDETVESDGSGNTTALNTWLASKGGASATDDCGDVTWSNNFAGLSDDCGATGSATVTFTATDDCGNTSTTTATFTIEDTTDPIALAQDLTVMLDASGAGSITAAQVDNGSNDSGQGTVSLELDVTSFDCDDVGPNTVTLTVTDECNLTSTASATITVQDDVNPVAICQDLTVQLDATGAVSITADDVDNGSSDACGIASMTLSKT